MDFYYQGANGGFQAIFFLVFFLIIGVVIVRIIQGIGQWNRNNQSPQLTVDAEVVAKRTSVSTHYHGNNCGDQVVSSTRYYVTFEVESGDRIELSMDGREYGMLAEGDRGKLSFQGTRYLGFRRVR